ncbi:hypothetical protein AeRB84_007087 [Aphanomyces euteiches]|nr:hypothetical protein AeRB84_007087 [Aphanomyces euteiches]
MRAIAAGSIQKSKSHHHHHRKQKKQPEAKKFKRESNQPAIHSFFTLPARPVDREDVKKPKLASLPPPPPPPQTQVMAPPPPPRIEIDLTIDSD